MNEAKIFRVGLMLSRGEILLASMVVGSLLGGFAAVAMQEHHYQKEVLLPHYQAKIAIQEKTIGELTNKQEVDWTKQGLSKLQVAILLRQQTGGEKYG